MCPVAFDNIHRFITIKRLLGNYPFIATSYSYKSGQNKNLILRNYFILIFYKQKYFLL